jgi:hypothetical protein
MFSSCINGLFAMQLHNEMDMVSIFTIIFHKLELMGKYSAETAFWGKDGSTQLLTFGMDSHAAPQTLIS